MNATVWGLRVMVRGVVAGFALMAGQVTAAPIFAPAGAVPGPSPWFARPAPPPFAAPPLAAGPRGFDERWSAPVWRFRPVPAPLPSGPGIAGMPTRPFAPMGPGPWGVPPPAYGFGGPGPWGVPPPAYGFGSPGPWVPPVAAVGFPPAGSRLGPDFARQYAWRPLPSRSALAAVYPTWAPGAAPAPHWNGGQDYRFQPPPPFGPDRLAGAPRWVAPAMPWPPYAPAFAPPPAAAGPWGLRAPGGDVPPQPVAFAYQRPVPAAFAAPGYRFRPDPRFGPELARVPPAPRGHADVAWEPAARNAVPDAWPQGGSEPPAFAVPGWDRAYN
jgi:hypothetical protein